MEALYSSSRPSSSVWAAAWPLFGWGSSGSLPPVYAAMESLFNPLASDRVGMDLLLSYFKGTLAPFFPYLLCSTPTIGFFLADLF